MKNLNKFSRYLFFITCLSGAIWLGSYIARLSITFDLFQGNDFVLRNNLTPQTFSDILFNLVPAYWLTLISYVIFFIFFILFLTSAKLGFRNNGWLFIITIVILLTFPFEAYLMVIDFKTITLLTGNSLNPEELLNLIIKRFKFFNSFPIIEIFCYFAVIFLIIFQPLTKNIVTEEH
jgi:hypothetical protein